MFLSDAIKEKAIWGEWNQYTYISSDGEIEGTVYCRNLIDFLKLINEWNRQCKIQHSNYYYIQTSENICCFMSAKDIQLDSKKIMFFLHDSRINVDYIH